MEQHQHTTQLGTLCRAGPRPLASARVQTIVHTPPCKAMPGTACTAVGRLEADHKPTGPARPPPHCRNCAAVPARKVPTGWFKCKLCTRTYPLPRCAPLLAVSTPLGDSTATTSIESLRQSMLVPPDAIHTTLVQQPCSAQTKQNCSQLAHMLCRQPCISCGCKPQEQVLSYGPGRCCCWHH